MYLLLPGRHHLFTNFQRDYINKICRENIGKEITLIIAITSCDHSGTKRNPFEFYHRVLMAEQFSNDLICKTLIYGIDDVTGISNFADYVIKRLEYLSQDKIKLIPQNCEVICSTPVMDYYTDLGYQVHTAEFNLFENNYRHPLPWVYLEQIGNLREHIENLRLKKETKKQYPYSDIHKSFNAVGEKYGLQTQLLKIFTDDTINGDGDLTDHRDYTSYTRQMDEIADLKFDEVKQYIKPGSILDIGCANGSWIRKVCEDERFKESDIYGVEIARHLYDMCLQRKHNGEFKNPYVYFYRKNAVTDIIKRKNYFDTIHTSSLTHEIESYCGRESLLKFIKNRYDELKPGGVWINRDVVGPENGNEYIHLNLAGNFRYVINDNKLIDTKNDMTLETKISEVHVSDLCEFEKFFKFCNDYKYEKIDYEIIPNSGISIKVKLKHAMEFLLKKDYVDNWSSEMNESFCYWNINDWISCLKEVGFKIEVAEDWTNRWIVEKRFLGLASIANENRFELPWPVTHCLIVAKK